MLLALLAAEVLENEQSLLVLSKHPETIELCLIAAICSVMPKSFR